jgi:hypothetical protein
VCEQVCEREFEVDAFFADPDLLEEGLVLDAAECVGCLDVRLEAVGNKVEGLVEVAFDLVESEGAGVEDPLGLGLFGGDAGLFFWEEVDGDNVGVVGVEEFLAFAAQLGEVTLLAVGLFGVESPRDLDVFRHVLTDPAETTRIEGDVPIVVGDLVFDLVGW